MQSIYRLSFLVGLLSLCTIASAVEITVERADALLAERNVDPWERAKDASVLAWNETTIVDAMLDLYDATDDTKYLDELVRRADRILSHRDDQRGFADYTGKVHPRWSIATKYTVGEGVIVDADDQPLIKLRSLPIANNHVTRVTITPAEDGKSFTLQATNKAWKRQERFADLSVDPDHPRHFAKVLNVESPLPKPPPTAGAPTASSETASLLLRADFIHGAREGAMPKAQTLTLTPLWHSHVGYVGIIYAPMLKFALLVRDAPALQAYQPAALRYIAAAEESYLSIREYYRTGPHDGEGYYVGAAVGGAAPYDGLPQAFNYIAKQAQSETMLFQLTGKDIYREHAVGIATLFKNRLEHQPKHDLYVWKYWYEPFTTGWSRGQTASQHFPEHAPYDVPEDASHGTLDVAMVETMAHAELVFNARDVQRLANTFLVHVAKADRTNFNSYVDGSEGPGEFEQAAVYGWLVLSSADPRVYHVCREIYQNRDRDDLKSLARLLKWERRLNAVKKR